MISIQRLKWRVLTALSIFFILTPFCMQVPVSASTALRLLETDWRTGEIEIKYEGVTPGEMIVVYGKTYRDGDDAAFTPMDTFFAQSESGRHITSYLENGQSIWYYIATYDPITNKQTGLSNRLKQTPPITAYIINWPDMLSDLDNMINKAIRDAATPSDKAINDLKDALDKLKDATGANSAGNTAGAIQDAINQGQQGMSQPIVNDDGNGTYSGGSTGGKLPGQPTTGDSGLQYPNPDSGTSNEMTMRLPYGVDMQGNLLYVKIFTDEQMEKMKWMDVIRKLAGATIWVMFAVWLTQRFTPQLKV